MIEINLLEAEPGRDEPGARGATKLGKVSWRAALAAACLLASPLYACVKLHSISGREAEVSAALPEAVADSLRTARTQETARAVLASRDSLVERATRLEAIRVSRGHWPNMLRELVSILPQELWLTSIVSLAEVGGPLWVRFEGVAHSGVEVAALNESLARSPRFLEVVLESPATTVAGEAWMPRTSFALVARFDVQTAPQTLPPGPTAAPNGAP